MRSRATQFLLSAVFLLLAFTASASLTPPPLPEFSPADIADSAALTEPIDWAALEADPDAVLAVLLVPPGTLYGDAQTVTILLVPCDPKNRVYRFFRDRQPPLGLWAWDNDWIQKGVGGLLGCYGKDAAKAGWFEVTDERITDRIGSWLHKERLYRFAQDPRGWRWRKNDTKWISELGDVFYANGAFGFMIALKPKVDVGPVKVEVGGGYERGQKMDYEKGEVKDIIYDKFVLVLAAKKGNSVVAGGEVSGERADVNGPRLYEPTLERIYDPWLNMERYAMVQRPIPWSRTLGHHERKWKWQIFKMQSDNGVEFSGVREDWKLGVGGTVPVAKGEIGVNLTEGRDLLDKILDAIAPLEETF